MSERTQLVATLAATLASWDESHSDEEQRKLALNQLNSWSEAADTSEPLAAFAKSVSWVPDPAVTNLPAPLNGIVDLKRPRFDYQDVDYLREATWFHFLTTRLAIKPASLDKDISKLPRDAQFAARIFDWTMLNVALDAPSWSRNGNVNPWQVPVDLLMESQSADRNHTNRQVPAEMLHTPYVTLYTGRGTALARGWVFLALARQAGLQGVLLAVTSTANGKSAEEPQPWLPAILVEGEWYLFDPQLGVPIPGPEGRGVATLKQLMAEPKLLRQLDRQGYEYPIKAEQLAGIVGLLEVAPQSVTLRMRQLQFDLPERVLALGTPKNPLPSEQIKLYEAAGLSKVSLWKHPWLVALARSLDKPIMEMADRSLQIQIAPFDVLLPTETVKELKAVRPSDVSTHEQQYLRKDVATGRFYLIKKEDAQLTDIPSDLDPDLYDVDPSSGEVFSKSGEPQNLVVDFRLKQVFRKYDPDVSNRNKTILELNNPVKWDPKNSDIIRFEPLLGGKEHLAKTLRHGRLMQIRGAWFRRAQLSSDGRNEQTSGAVEVPEDLHGAIYWLLLSKAADGAYGPLIASESSRNDLKPFLSFLQEARVPEFEIAAVRELIVVANLKPEQVDLLVNMLQAPGVDANKVRETITYLLKVRPSQELSTYFEPLAKLAKLDLRAVQNMAESFVSGNHMPRYKAPIMTKLTFLRVLHDINRRATLWLGQIQAEQGEYESAERYFRQYNQIGYWPWYSAAQLNLAALLVHRGFEALEKDPSVAIKLWKEAIAIYQADESLQKQGSFWRAKQLNERISSLSVDK